MDSQRTQHYSENNLPGIILDSAIKVHQQLGPGLLESSYQACLAYELKKEAIYRIWISAAISYEDIHLECGYRIDLFINRKVIIEIKSVEAFNNVHLAQILTYLKLSECKLGLLINFNEGLLKDGYRRVVNNL